MLNICLAFWESEPQYAYKRYAYKKTCSGRIVKSHVEDDQLCPFLE